MAHSIHTGGSVPYLSPVRQGPTTQLKPVLNSPLPQESVSLTGLTQAPPEVVIEQQAPEAKAQVSKEKPAAVRVPSTLLMEAPAPESNETLLQSALAKSLVQHFETHLQQNPKARAALEKWTPEQRAKLDALIGHSSMELSFLHQGAHTPTKAMSLLPDLIASGKLLDKDKTGKTTLDHLREIQSQPLEGNFQRGVVVSELLANLQNPGEINQRNRGTCTVTTIEYFHASQQPSDYTRLVKELVHSQGKAHFQTGQVCWTNPTGVGEDHSGRSSVDRIYQSSMMQAAYKGIALYNNHNDTFWTLGWNRQFRDSGLFSHQSGYLMEQVLGKPTKVMEYEGNRKRFEADMIRALNLGQTVFVAMAWHPDPNDRDSNHALAVEKIENGKVYLRNPWGDGEKGGDNGPPRELVDDKGRVVVSQDDFFAHLKGAIRPERNFFHVWANRIRYHLQGEGGILKD